MFSCKFDQILVFSEFTTYLSAKFLDYSDFRDLDVINRVQYGISVGKQKIVKQI